MAITGAKKSKHNAEYYAEHRKELEEKRRKRRKEHAKERRMKIGGSIRASLLSQLQRILIEGTANGSYPWRSFSEVLEGVLIVGMKEVGARYEDPDLVAATQDWAFDNRMEAMQRLRQRMQGRLQIATEETQELLRIGAKGDAEQWFSATLADALKAPHTTWRDWFIEEYREGFPNLARKFDDGTIATMELDPIPKYEEGSTSKKKSRR